MIKIKKVNFGCGDFKKKGFINVDWNKKINPDVVCDLGKFPYPFKNNDIDFIEADHVLEHLEEPLRVMKEFHRITKKGGEVIIRVPHFSRGFTHPEHKCGFDVSFPLFFSRKLDGVYMGCEFETKSVKLNWFSQPYLKKKMLSKLTYYVSLLAGYILNFFANLSPIFCSRIWCFLVGGFDEIEFHFIKK